jgi:hypothetical protein
VFVKVAVKVATPLTRVQLVGAESPNPATSTEIAEPAVSNDPAGTTETVAVKGTFCTTVAGVVTVRDVVVAGFGPAWTGTGVGVGVGDRVGLGVGVGEGVGLGVGVGVDVGLGVGVGPDVGEGVGEAVGVGVGLGVADGVGEGVGEGLGVGEGVEVGVGAGLTATDPETPAMEEVTVSVAVTVWAPGKLKVTEKLPTPLASVPLAGSVADPSLLVM